MWFTRKRSEYGCPVCGRLPKIIRSLSERGYEFISIYRLKCPRNHTSTGWFDSPRSATLQWKDIVDEYKGRKRNERSGNR